ncbi:MAG: hypothetical protein HA492_05760 [Candidatus Verstraetearchaeota archaeon]|nr:hypothetical protein [Candidatus Verstraetearchaeota archaeon]
MVPIAVNSVVDIESIKREAPADAAEIVKWMQTAAAEKADVENYNRSGSGDLES